MTLVFGAGMVFGVLLVAVVEELAVAARQRRERREIEAARERVLAILSEPLRTVRNKPDGSYTWVWRFSEENPEQVVERVTSWAR